MNERTRPRPREAFGHPAAKRTTVNERPGFLETAEMAQPASRVIDQSLSAQLPPRNPSAVPRDALSARIRKSGQREDQP
jgi:hypothetical protein